MACMWPHENHLWETLSTLRFATRMRCIENHPHRNALVTGNGANSSTRTLMLKIESLKRELALRDMMYSYGVNTQTASAASPRRVSGSSSGTGNVSSVAVGGGVAGAGAMSKNQQTRCLQMTHDFVLTNVDTDTVDVKSLAEVAAVAKTLRSAIWLACGQDEQRVAEVMGALCGDAANTSAGAAVSSMPEMGRGVDDNLDNGEENAERLPQPPTSPVSPRPSRPIPKIVEKQSALTMKPEGEKVDKIVERRLEVDDQEEQQVNEHRLTTQSSQQPDNEDTAGDEGGGEEGPFDRFKVNEGWEQHSSYEGIKLRLKEAKAFQRTLVKVVNEYKAKIDVKTDVVQQITAILNGDSAEDIASAGGLERVTQELQEAQGELAKWKSEYKTSRSELLKCKENIAELTVQKQRALNVLVKAFEEYSVLTTG